MAYDVFISYRRTDASNIAHWIRNRLQRYRLPKEVLPLLPAEAKESHDKKLRVFIDRAYEKANDDFLEKKIFPALENSRRLIVISTPSVFDTIRDGNGSEHPNWLVREIDHFVGTVKNNSNARSIDLVLGPGGSDNKYPGRLADKARWDWIDLRNFSWWHSWGISASLDEGFIKLVAAVYDVPDEALPLLREEEQRQRRKLIVIFSLIALIITLLISTLAIGWRTEVNARRAVDSARQLNIAQDLINNGAIDRAIDTLAHLEEIGSPANIMEAKRLLQMWVPRLMTAKDQLSPIPNNSIIRWRGLNYLKTGDGVLHSFEGPPVLQSAVSSNGEWLLTFESDRAIRVRTIHSLGTPILETARFNVTHGTISELMQGRLLVFDGNELAPFVDEDSGEQEIQGRRIILLDPITKIYGTALIVSDFDKFIPSCDRIRATGSEISVVSQGTKREEVFNGVLTLSVEKEGRIHWDAKEKEMLNQNETGGADHVPSCLTQLNEAKASSFSESSTANFTFPKVVDEALMWTKLGTAPRIEMLPDVCNGDESDSNQSKNCYDASQAISIDKKRSSSLATILRQQEISPKIFAFEDQWRIAILTALGKDYWGYALCNLETKNIIEKCLVAYLSLNSSTRYSSKNQFLILNGEEVVEDMFQLLDIKSMRFIKTSPPIMEFISNFTFSPDGARMAIQASSGEVWLYEVDRENSTATIVEKYDFGKFFDSMDLVSNELLVLASSNSGILAASIPSGEIIWSRPSVKLSGSGSHIISAADDTLVVYDRESMQLLSPKTGALLTQVLKFSDLPQDPRAVEDEYLENWFSLKKGANGQIQFVYKGVIYGPAKSIKINSSDWSEIEKRTGRSRFGTNELLPYFLGE